VLILAGAGSGKTRVITYRIAHLIDAMGVMPESILAVTFTTKPRRRWGEPWRSLPAYVDCEARLATFHSFCVRVLAAGH